MNVTLYIIILLVEFVVLLGASIYGVGLIFSALKGAPYVPTSNKQLAAIFNTVPLKKGMRMVELGSGDGRVLRYGASHYGIRGVGIEINILLVWWARFLALREGISDQVRFIKENVFNYSLREADIVYLFLMPELIEKLLPKMQAELKKGCLVISHGFKIVGLSKKHTHTHIDKTFSTYYYTI